MQGQKRAHEVLGYSPSPSKRSKNDAERWRSWETSNHAAAPVQMIGGASNHTYTLESDRTPAKPLEERGATPSRSTYFGFIYDALSANPSGLRSHEIFEWLRENRPIAFKERGEEKFRVSIQTTLSAQSNKKEPTIWKYKEGKSNGSGYIWRLPNAEQTAEGVATTQSPHDVLKTGSKRDGINASNEEAQAITPYPPHRLHPEDSALDTSVSPMLLPLQKNVSDVSTTRAEHDSGSSEAGLAPVQKTPPKGRSAVVVGPARLALEVEALAEEDTQRLPGMTSDASATNKETLNTAVPVPARNPSENRTIVVPHDVVIIDGPEDRGSVQDDACMSESRQQLYFGKLVMQLRSLRHKRELLKQEVESNCNTSPDIPALKCNADQMQKRAQELAQQAEEARQEADIAYRNLASAQDQAKKVESAEEELYQIDQELKEAREELRID
ncbi:hypothetical protein LTR49_027304 [Elasticomyces elasticus]|nr:hypothetical protein LTR49_027304 [Elasticomyces elasticus]